MVSSKSPFPPRSRLQTLDSPSLPKNFSRLFPFLFDTSLHPYFITSFFAKQDRPLSTNQHPLKAISFRIRTYEKLTRKPFRIRTYKIQHLKSFRIRTYEKIPRGVGYTRQSGIRRSTPCPSTEAFPPNHRLLCKNRPAMGPGISRDGPHLFRGA